MRKALSYMRKAVEDYNMIREGDHITVGVSGGKDSLTLLVTLAALKRFYPEKFTLSAISIDMGFEGMDFSPIRELCDKLEVPYYIKKTDIREIIFDVRKEKNPCSLCANMRRGALNEAAKEIGSDKVALGHHYDDVIETFWMNQIFEGRLGCFSPVTYLDRKEVWVIRPMIYMPEWFVKSFSEKENLPIVKNKCTADGNTMREEVKKLLSEMEGKYPGLRQRLFTALCTSEISGWRVASAAAQKNRRK
ncbi:MAG: tRNA 2-thiocytidine(32) synthetase TtcA [Clostridia bacterium]|nr:tRNA 2-thiocytidine(32) synthetase TtcA [Clostridia bacterium]